MVTHPLRLWGTVGTLVALLGLGGLVQRDLNRQREAFEVDARIVHRLLSQRVVQHDAMLATLALLQPGADAPSQKLPTLYPQIRAVWRHDAQQPWPDPTLHAAQDLSQARQRGVLAQAQLPQGQYVLLQAAEPASYALQIQLAQVVPWDEWPVDPQGPVQITLTHQGQRWTLQPGDPSPGLPWGWGELQFSKVLASPSQPFDVQVHRRLGWSALPWGQAGLWLALMLTSLALGWAWARQRQARQRAEELLRMGQAARLTTLGELAAGLAHELNQPLTAILASSQAAQRLLSDASDTDPLLRQALAQSVQQARRASEVLGRLRRLVQPPQSEGPPPPLALTDAVASVLYVLEPECERRQVSPVWVPPQPTVWVQVDRVALEQVIFNLVMNALQALDQMPPPARQLALLLDTPQPGQARLRVQDSGPGLSSDAQQRAFEPFFSTRPSGLGLGLSLCETLVLAMDGQLAGHNQADGPGAEFVLTLPTVLPPSTPP